MNSTPLIATLLLIGSTAFGQTTRFVSTTGTDTGDCSDSGSPCQTINYAISQATDGDVVKLGVGTYASATVDKRITLRGKGYQTSVSGLSISAPVSGSSYVYVRDLTVSGGSVGIAIATSFVHLDSLDVSGHSSRNINVDASGSITDLIIEKCKLNDGGTGLWIDETTALDGLTMTGTELNGNEFGFYSQLGNSTSNTMLENVVIRNCTFNHNDRKGIYCEKLSDAVMENISVIGSGVDPTYAFNNGIDINLKWQAYSNIEIRNSRILGCGDLGPNNSGTSPENRRSTAIAIKARTDAGSYNSDPASLSNVTLDGVIIDGLATDLRFGEMGKLDNTGIDMSTVTVTNCSLASDDIAGLLNEEITNTLTISHNYWGGGTPSPGTDLFTITGSNISQSNELSDLIVDESNNSYADFASALAGVSASGTIKNIPQGLISGTTIINKNVTLSVPGAGLLDSTNSLVSFADLTVSGGVLTLMGDVEVTGTLTLEDDVILGDYTGSAGSVIVNSGGSIQDGVAMAADGTTVTVASGTFSEDSIYIDRSISLNGANAGTAASGTRGAETIIEPSSSSNGLFVDTDNVAIDGFELGQSNLLTGFVSDGFTDITITNSIINTDSIGIYINDATTGAITISQNQINTSGFVGPSLSGLTSGISLSGLTSSVDVDVNDNAIDGGTYGLLVFDCASSAPLSVSNLDVTNLIQGILVSATNGTYEQPNSLTIDGLNATAFDEPGGGITNIPQTGVYIYTNGSATLSDVQDVTITNSTIGGTGSTTSDYAGIICGDFSGVLGGTIQDITISGTTVENNLNRGIYVRGRNTTASLSDVTFTENGADPTGSGGNPGFHLVVRNDAVVDVINSVFTNPASQTSDQFDGLSLQTGSTLTITNSRFNQNGNGSLATTSGIDLSGNYLGSTDETDLGTWINAGCDYTPYLGSGTDSDPGTDGFQGDFGNLFVTNQGSQTGSTERVQEAHDLADASGTVSLNLDDFSESLTVSKNLTLSPLSNSSDTVSLDDLTMNGSSISLTLDANLRISSSITFTDGTIDVTNGALILAPAVPDPVESSSSRLMGSMVLEPRTIGTGSLDILGVSISAGVDDMGMISISRETGPGAVVTGGVNNSIAVQWQIDVDTEPAAGRDVGFTWLSDFDNGLDVSNLQLFKNSGSGWLDVDDPQDVSSSDPRVFTPITTTTFSSWTMAEGGTVLPIELLYFKAKKTAGIVALEWATASERNTSHFELERKLHGGEFVSIAEIKAVGESKTKQVYTYQDRYRFLDDEAFYRLKSVDFDGFTEVFDAIRVGDLISSQVVKLYPNPTSDYVVVRQGSYDQYAVISMAGKQVIGGMLNEERIDLRSLPAGNYIIQLSGKDGGNFSALLVKE